MAKVEAENIYKMDLKALFALKKTLESQRYQELVKNISTGKKSSNKSVEQKKKIAQIETAISQKLQDALQDMGEKNE